MTKQVIVKVYTSLGTYIETWNNVQFDSFTKEINSGLGECVLDLAEKFDYGGADLKLGNYVNIYISDRETVLIAAGSNEPIKLIYSGYISLIEATIDSKNEGIKVHLLGHYTKLSMDILKNNVTVHLYSDDTAGITTTAPGSAADIGLMLRGILDRYIAETTNPVITYSTATIPLTSTTALYVFEQITYKDALEKVVAMAPSGYFYYIDENNFFWLKSKPTTATHKFVFGKHFTSLRVEKSMEKVRNFILLWDGAAALKAYSNSDSIASYGRRVGKLKDYSIKDTTSADKIGAKFIAENKDPDTRVICEILDNNGNSNFGYDIESINPGDTCTFFGFDETSSDILYENMLISKVVYSLDSVELTIEAVKSGVIDWAEKMNIRLDDEQSTGAPATYS